MICKRLYRSILQNCEEMEKAMYDYGLQCASEKQIDFAAVAETFDKLEFENEDRDSNVRIIIKGFFKGLSKARE